jgi:hypothetical protein
MMSKKKIAVVYYNGNEGGNWFMAQVARELAETFDVELLVVEDPEQTLDPHLPDQPAGIHLVVHDHTMGEKIRDEWGGVTRYNAYRTLAEFNTITNLVRRVRELTALVEAAGLPWAIVTYALDDHVSTRRLASSLQESGFTLVAKADLPSLAENCVLLLDHHARTHGVVRDEGNRKHVCICPCCFGRGSFAVEATLSHVTHTADRLRQMIEAAV